MKSASLFAVAFAALSAAQLVKDYFPKCAVECVIEATGDATDCDSDDAWCQCIQENYEAIYDSGFNCVMSDCGADKAVAEVLPAGVRFCSAATSAHESSTAAPETTGSDEASTVITSAPATTTKDTTEETETEESSEETDSPDAAVTAAPVAAMGLLVAGVVAML